MSPDDLLPFLNGILLGMVIMLLMGAVCGDL